MEWQRVERTWWWLCQRHSFRPRDRFGGSGVRVRIIHVSQDLCRLEHRWHQLIRSMERHHMARNVNCVQWRRCADSCDRRPIRHCFCRRRHDVDESGNFDPQLRGPSAARSDDLQRDAFACGTRWRNPVFCQRRSPEGRLHRHHGRRSCSRQRRIRESGAVHR